MKILVGIPTHGIEQSNIDIGIIAELIVVVSPQRGKSNQQ